MQNLFLHLTHFFDVYIFGRVDYLPSDLTLDKNILNLDVVVILETVLNMGEELKDVESVDASVEQGVHAFKSGLAEVESIINFVLKRSHLNLGDKNKSHNSSL